MCNKKTCKAYLEWEIISEEAWASPCFGCSGEKAKEEEPCENYESCEKDK